MNPDVNDTKYCNYNTSFTLKNPVTKIKFYFDVHVKIMKSAKMTHGFSRILCKQVFMKTATFLNRFNRLIVLSELNTLFDCMDYDLYDTFVDGN
ncbi:hypothetical protein BpHYR1_012170 [Brachionus plicatilis]|uniref:Uncharacterized protein n=1 Tax=Brachionus plicatilis TaxID=10195 RepID=A0A3M7SCR8_BRAPC|nr:hypothetical protein BpHYR1_012170 [Brachionus plicatilis]